MGVDEVRTEVGPGSPDGATADGPATEHAPSAIESEVTKPMIRAARQAIGSIASLHRVEKRGSEIRCPWYTV